MKSLELFSVETLINNVTLDSDLDCSGGRPNALFSL